LAHIYSVNTCTFIGEKMLGRSILEKNETGESYPIYFYMNLMVLEIITGK